MPTWWNHLKWDYALHTGARKMDGTIHRTDDDSRLYRAALWVLLLGRTRYTP